MSLNTNALVTIDDVKDYYGLKSSAHDVNTLIEELINRISTLFESISGNIKAADYTEFYDGENIELLFVGHLPIISITSINDDPEWDWEAATLIDSVDYMIHSCKRYIVLKVSLANNVQNVKIVYRAGFEVIPEDIKHACIEEIVRKYKHRTDFDVTSKSREDGSVSYTQKGLMPLTIKILKKYKQLLIG